ncbi:stalk domain-containing protein [Paenibacillus sp. DCT19]|uniref:stalk domain-containing protein n=1 Tax=Paenibacillus sp. DCT19 TaxID=2211212 RepID=UPI000FE21220|nr:stalk domain-containing protein [Paenibacillus sp. DCT19]
MKRFISLLLMLCLVGSVSSIASANNQPLEDLPLVERAAHMYNSSLKKSVLNVTKAGKLTTTEYNSIFIPVKDVFKSSGANIQWDGKNKITTIKNKEHELILNFSEKTVIPRKNQLIVPKEWLQLKNGASTMNAFVLAYLFEVYADESDQERVEWEKQLEFLDIKQTTGIGGIDGYMHVFVEFNE